MADRPKREPKRVLAWVALFAVVSLLWVSWPKPAVITKYSAVRAASPAETSSATETPAEKAEVITDLLNLRGEPKTDRKTIIGVLRSGVIVTIVERKDKWLQVRLSDGRTGYIVYEPKYLRFLDQ